MNKTIRRLALAITLAALALVPGIVQAQAYSSPRLMLMRYFTALNRRDYASAYAYWAYPPRSLYGFQVGFEETHHIIPYIGAAQVLGRSTVPPAVRIPAVLLAYSMELRLSAWYGCFTMSQRAGWRIESADLTEIPDLLLPDRTSILSFLASVCETSWSSAEFNVLHRADAEAQNTVNAYFDGINSKYFDYAYESWLSPNADYGYNRARTPDYRPPFDDFVAGYARTMYADVYFGPYLYIAAKSGKRYLEGMQPVVIVEQHYDGSFASFYGCFVLGRSDYGYLGIVNVKLIRLDSSGVIPDAATIFRYADTYCPSLGIPL